MANTRTLLSALESIAYDEDERDVLHSLDRIRTELARETTEILPEKKGRNDWTIKSAAYGLLNNAASLARKKKGKRAILRVAASFMGQMVDQEVRERNLECLFVVRAVWKRDRPELKLVGPVDARPRFLIGYAFWLAAKSLPISAWVRMKRKRCPVCKRWFADNSRGRPKTYCSDACYTEAHAKMDKRRAKR